MLAGGVHFHLGAFKLVQLLADGSLQGIVGKQNSISALSDLWAAEGKMLQEMCKAAGPGDG